MIKIVWSNETMNRNGELTGYDDIDFATEAEAEAWFLAQNNFGKHDRWLRETDGSHTETRQGTTEMGEEFVEYFFPAEYTYEILDITAEYEAEQALKAAKKAKKEELKTKKWKSMTEQDKDDLIELLMENM